MNDPGFLASIIAQPDDDTPRLVYADWLDEHDQPERAEIIRVQCGLARLRYNDDAVSELQAREHRLLSRHLPRWREEMGLRDASLHRGFVETFPHSHPDSFLKSAEELFSAHPIRELNLYCQEDAGWGKDVAECPYLSRIETLRLPQERSCWTELSDFMVILSSPHLTNVTTLDAGGTPDYGDVGLREMLGVSRRKAGRKCGLLPSLRKLRRLSLSGMGLTDHGLRLLAHSPLSETLTALDLSRGCSRTQRFTAAGISALVESPLWPRLEELNLSGNLFEDAEPFRILFTSLHRSRIRRLGIRHNWNDDTRRVGLAEAMTTAPSWGQLEALDLPSGCLSNDGLRLLCRGEYLAGLHWLAFDSGLDDEGVRELARCPHAVGLTALSVNDEAKSLTDQGMRYLAESPYLTGLVHLNIDWTAVHDKGVADFIRSPNAARLRLLAFPSNLGDEVLQAIADSLYTSRLNVVQFGGLPSSGYDAGLSDAGILALTRSTSLPNLTCIIRRLGRLDDDDRITSKSQEALMECERLALVEGLSTTRDDRFGKRFPLHDYELLGFRFLPLFPWSQYND